MKATNEDEPRSRALLRLVPPLVHHLNNALAVVQGVHELGPRADAEQRAQANVALATLRRSLAHLAVLARPRPEPLELETLVGTLALLVQPLAASLQRSLEVHAHGEAVLAVDAGFSGLFVAACVAELAAVGAPGAPLRVRARAAAGRVSLHLSAAGRPRASAEWSALAAHAREHGWPLRAHSSARAFGLRLVLPAETHGHGEVRGPTRTRSKRVLLLHGGEEERALVTDLLREHGCSVTASGAEPRAEGGKAFDLGLIEARLARADPALVERLRTRFALRRIELLEPRMRPGALLALLTR